MKLGIHPTYHDDAKVVCACGATFITGSTKPVIHVDVCSVCHPFFTGTATYIDTLGRVEKFQAKQARHIKLAESKPKKQPVEVEEGQERPATLKEMVAVIRKQSQKSTEDSK